MKKLTLLLFISCCMMSCNDVEKTSTENIDNSSKKALHIDKNAGKEWNVFGVKIIGKILSEDTDGTYAVIMSNTPPGGGPPLHVHSKEDELFYVLKGTYEFTCGEEKILANEGSLVKLPRGIPHRFVNLDTVEGVTMNTITPGGFENYFEQIAVAGKEGKLNKTVVDSIAEVYGLQFIHSEAK